MERKTLMLLLAAVMVSACAEPTAIPPDEEAADLSQSAPNLLAWDPAAAPIGFKGQVLRENAAIPQAPPTIVTTTSTYSFWVTQGQAATVELYTVAFDLSERLYVKMHFPSNALAAWPDGRAINAGESVQITMGMDPQTMVVVLEPYGLRLNAGAKLTMSYGQASRDFDGDGAITSRDVDIEMNQLGMWRRPSPTGSWTRITAVRDLVGRSFEGEIGALSGYALSW